MGLVWPRANAAESAQGHAPKRQHRDASVSGRVRRLHGGAAQLLGCQKVKDNDPFPGERPGHGRSISDSWTFIFQFRLIIFVSL